MCVRVCVRACVRVCVRACVRACVRVHAGEADLGRRCVVLLIQLRVRAAAVHRLQCETQKGAAKH